MTSPADVALAAEDRVGGDRRWFLRSAAAGALAIVTSGAHLLFGAPPAAAATSCCTLVRENTPWCPLACAEIGHNFRCWTCVGQQCKCCECTIAKTCWTGISLCSYETGCCEEP